MAVECNQIVRELRALEKSIETHVSDYSRLSTQFNEASGDIEAGNSVREKAADLENRASIQFQKFDELVKRLGEALKKAPSPANAAMLQRFVEVQREYKVELDASVLHFRRKQAERSLLEQSKQPKVAGTGMDSLLRERSSLAQSHRAADEALASAVTTHESLQRQRVQLQGSSGGLGRIIGQLPTAGSLIAQISARRLRNDRLVAVIIGLLLCLVIYVKLLR